MKNRVISGFLIVSVLIGLFFLLFERKKVSSLNWNNHYQYESKNPLGLWLFSDLLKKKFGKVTSLSTEETIDDHREDGILFVEVNSRITYDQIFSDEILESAADGNHFLFSARELLFGNLTEFSCTYQDSFEADLITYSVSGKTFSTTFRHWDYFKENAALIYNFDCFHKDSVLRSDHFELRMYNKSGNPDDVNNGYKLTEKLIDSSEFIMTCFKVGEGSVCFHTIPYLFTNIHSEDTAYLPHFNAVFDRYDVNEVVLLKPQDGGIISRDQSSPLRYLLEHPALRLAYYLTLSGLLIYLFFGSKRKQKQIGILSKKENTITEFTDTVSRLYLAQGRNDKIIYKMIANFHHFVENKYTIKEKEEDFWIKLERKSKVSKSVIEELMTTVKKDYTNIRDYSTEVEKAYNIFNNFYKKVN